MLFSYSVRAPEFPKNFQWLNTKEPLSLQHFRGQVVVLDFWTYCCINCVHILPDLKFLEDRYRDKPVAVIGVHSAKFANEQDPDNITSAIARYQIEHPVIVDHHHQIWDSYAVRAWPTFVVIDAEGKIRAHFSGEGHRQDLDTIIHKLLVEGRQKSLLSPKPPKIERPEIPKGGVLSFPGKLAFHPSKKELFISDSNHHQLLHTKLLNPTTAEIVSVIGSGQVGQKNGSYAQASFNQPQGVYATEQALYICDTENHLLRKVSFSEQRVETVAGIGEQAQWGERGGAALVTALNSPWDIVGKGLHHQLESEFYLAMAGSHQVWKFDEQQKTVEVLAGSGGENIVDGPLLSAQLAQPSGITMGEGSLYIADSEVSAVRRLDLHHDQVRTIVGAGLFTFGLRDGELEDALLQHPLGITYDNHLLYVADTYNHAIRLIDLKKEVVKTLIKRESHTVCSIDDKNCDVLPLNEPNDVKKHEHFLYIADTNNHLVRVFDLQKKTLEELKIKGL